MYIVQVHVWFQFPFGDTKSIFSWDSFLYPGCSMYGLFDSLPIH